MQVVEFYPYQGSVVSIIVMIWLPNSCSGISSKIEGQVETTFG
jgi:hypothetical protein